MFTKIKIAGALVFAGLIIAAVFYVKHLQSKVDVLISEKTQLEILVESKNVEINSILTNQEAVLKRLQNAELVIGQLSNEKNRRDKDLTDLKEKLEKFEFDVKPKETVESFLTETYNKRLECLENLSCEE